MPQRPPTRKPLGPRKPFSGPKKPIMQQPMMQQGFQSALPEALKKAFLMGLGAAALAADKVNDKVKDLAEDLINKGVLKPQEAHAFVEELKRRVLHEKDQLAEGFSKQVGQQVSHHVNQAIKSLGLVTRQEFEAALGKPAFSQSFERPRAENPRAGKSRSTGGSSARGGSSSRSSSASRKPGKSRPKR